MEVDSESAMEIFLFKKARRFLKIKYFVFYLIE